MEGISQAKKTLEVYEPFGGKTEQANALLLIRKPHASTRLAYHRFGYLHPEFWVFFFNLGIGWYATVPSGRLRGFADGPPLAEYNRIDAAEEATSRMRMIDLSLEESRQPQVCKHRHILSHIYRPRGETEAAISHPKTAFGIASSLDWKDRGVSVLRCR